MTTNEVTSEGLIVQTLPEIVTDLETAFKAIYGSDISVAQNSPDGQMIGIMAQLKSDLLDLITQVYNSFDPEHAEGASLDARVAINGIQRNGGTYTITPIDVTVDRALTLNGIDSVDTPFTVADAAGNQYQLISEVSPAGAGTYTYNFQAVTIGVVQPQLNTITTQVTVVVGVTAVNNPDAAGEIGVAEESDADLRLRRNVSLAVGSTNSLDSMRAGLLNIANVSDAYVHENFTGSVDAYNVSGHTIWPIVEGGTDAAIGTLIYAKRSAGCGMQGGESVAITQPSGDIFTVYFDRPIYVPLHIQFYLTAKVAGATYVEADVKTDLAAALTYAIFETADAADIAKELLTLLPLFIPSGVEISTDGATWGEILQPTTPQEKFTVSTANITILTP